MDLELSEDSPLHDWVRNIPESYGDTTYEWVKESEGYKIRIENIGEQWKVVLFHKSGSSERTLERAIADKNEYDIELARAIAEEYAENYKNLLQIS